MAAYATLGALSLLWGTSFLLIKIAAGLFAPLGFALARVGVAAATLLAVAALSGRLWPGRRLGLWATLVGLSLLGQVAPFLLLGVAARLTTSADMALMMETAPIFVFVAGRFVPSGDQWTLLGALGLAVGFVGLTLAMTAPAAATAGGEGALAGRAFALAAAFCYAMNALISGAATREIGAVRAVAASMTLSTLILGLVALATGAPLVSATSASPPLVPLAAMAALGVFNTALAYFVYFRLIASEGPTFASLNNYIVPVIGVVGGAWALGERVPLMASTGLALVLAGVLLTGQAARRRG